MAKVTSFFRRIFSSILSDDDCSSVDNRKSLILIPPITSTSNNSTIRSCSASPRTISKQTTIQHDNHRIHSAINSINRSVNRRLSAPLIIHASIHPRQHRSTINDETTEETTLSPYQRLSLSSTTGTTSIHPNSSVHSLVTSTAGSASTSPRQDLHFSSLNLSPSNSINLPNSVNNISPASGTPPSQFPAGASSSSPRASIPSNNSASPSSDRRMSLQGRGRRPSMFDPIDPRELQQALYASAAVKASLSCTSSVEDDLNRAHARLTISYERDSEQVFLDLLSFENLQTLEGYTNDNHGEFISFYCRFRLHPDKRSLFQTKIFRLPRNQTSYVFDRKNLNNFPFSYEQLNTRSIEILFYKISTNKSSLYKDIRLATVKFPLNELLHTDQSRMSKLFESADVASIIQDPDLGELRLSLSYLQSAAKLSVVILEAKNLRPLTTETKTLPDVCAKVTLYDRHGKRIKRKKTSVQRTSDCPIFNEELVFELRREIASEIIIEVRLVHESLSYKEQLGSVVFGPILHPPPRSSICPENVYWSTVLSGESLSGQWQIIKPSNKFDESK